MLSVLVCLLVLLTVDCNKHHNSHTKVKPLISRVRSPTSTRLPIVYVYTVVPAVCKHGLPDYIKESLEQAIMTQPDCDIILASNFADCEEIDKTVENVPELVKIDTTKIASNRTTYYKNVSSEIFQSDSFNELWITSALRFLIMEDIMKTYNYTDMLHIEADNLLYGRITAILPILRKHYKLAATPLTANKSFITASVFWINSLDTLVKFNDYMLDMGTRVNSTWKNYLKWLRFFACCKPGGVDPDENGRGIKPFAVNEMSMLAYYHEIHPEEFKLLPVVPAYNYVLNRYVCNMSIFGPGGSEIGHNTGHGIWDSNSWGQWMGGTHYKRGRDTYFTDPSHISGQAIRMNSCVAEMMCGNQTVSPYYDPHDPLTDATNSTGYEIEKVGCYTAPFVRCGTNETGFSEWTPLWNLHVHSKHTFKFLSKPCPCPAPTRAASALVV